MEMNKVKNQLTYEYDEVPATARYYKVKGFLCCGCGLVTQPPSGKGGPMGGGRGPELWGGEQ